MDDFERAGDIARLARPDIPVTCFRPQALRNAAQYFTQNFPGKPLYAVKANPAPFVLESLYHAGIRHFDAASVAEIELVRKHCPDAFIAFMHPVKSRPAIEQAYFDHGVRDFSFDSIDEMEKIVEMTGRSADLGLLLRLAVPNADAAMPLRDKFGCAPTQAAAILQQARKHAKRLGICFHVGSQTMSPAAYTRALDIVGDILRSIPDTTVDIIDVGGGFPAIYPGMTPPPMQDFMTAIQDGFARLPHPSRYDFWCEPGRALVAESASVLVQVNLRKDDVLYINDGTYGSLFDAGHMGFCYPVKLVRTGAGDRAAVNPLPFRFYGPTCDSVDYMPGPFVLPDTVREGDYIEIFQLGAYGSAMRTAFNGFDTHLAVIVHDAPPATMYPAADKIEKTAVQALRTPSLV